MKSDQNGFTLIELLIVVLIIGILAALAIPQFLNQRQRAHDADAKANARNLVTHMEACFSYDDGYLGCSTALNQANTGLPVIVGPPTPGGVLFATVSASGYQIVATSRAETGGAAHRYIINHNVGGVYGHDCTPQGAGGCPDGGDW